MMVPQFVCSLSFFVPRMQELFEEVTTTYEPKAILHFVVLIRTLYFECLHKQLFTHRHVAPAFANDSLTLYLACERVLYRYDLDGISQVPTSDVQYITYPEAGLESNVVLFDNSQTVYLVHLDEESISEIIALPEQEALLIDLPQHGHSCVPDSIGRKLFKPTHVPQLELQ